jgi:hypothetical protein
MVTLKMIWPPFQLPFPLFFVELAHPLIFLFTFLMHILPMIVTQWSICGMAECALSIFKGITIQLQYAINSLLQLQKCVDLPFLLPINQSSPFWYKCSMLEKGEGI